MIKQKLLTRLDGAARSCLLTIQDYAHVVTKNSEAKKKATAKLTKAAELIREAAVLIKEI